MNRLVKAIEKRAGVNPKEGEKKYGEVNYADEKNKKYPIDTEEHVRAALSYWGMPKNREKYSAEDQKTIGGKIHAAAKRLGIDVSATYVTAEYAVDLNGSAPNRIMYFPAGDSKISASVGGEAKEVEVRVDAETALLLQNDLEQRLQGNVRPIIDFNHQLGAAAALPKRFEWVEGEGVFLELDWTRAGKYAVEGKDYSFFSPTFLLDPEGCPVGLPPEGAIGALTNDPAFRTIERISAKKVLIKPGDEPDNKQNEEEDMELAKALVSAGFITEEDSKDTSKIVAAIQAKTKKESDGSLNTEIEALRAELQQVRVEGANKEADAAIVRAVAEHRIEPKNETMKASIKKLYLANKVEAENLIKSLPVNKAFEKAVIVTSDQDRIKTETDGRDRARKCEAAAKRVQKGSPNMSFQDAWNVAATEDPELFQAV